jgi:creatinine amidohydrolase
MGRMDAMPETPIRYWQSLTTVDVADVVAQDPVVILPLAAIEQHGPHLPLSTDLEIGIGLLECAFGRLPAGFPAWVLPPQAIGSSQEHARFPGTLTLPQEIVVAAIHQIGTALAHSGVRRLVLANSHGGNRAVLDAAALGLRAERGMLVVKASYFDFARPEGLELPDAEWRHGLHGGAVETAMMLHLRPDLVRCDAMAEARSLGEDLDGTLRHLGPEGPAPFAWLAGDLHPSGVVGDARRADARMGERLVRHYGGVLADVIQDARGFPLDRLR